MDLLISESHPSYSSHPATHVPSPSVLVKFDAPLVLQGVTPCVNVVLDAVSTAKVGSRGCKQAMVLQQQGK